MTHALRLATFNIQHGLAHGGLPDDSVRPLRALPPGALGEALAGVDVDVLALQEVDVGQPRSGRADQAAVIARATGLRHYRFAAAVEGDVRGARRPARSTTAPPAYGIALMSRHPVLAWFAQPLPRAPLGVRPAPLAGLAIPGVPHDDEPRVALAAVIRFPQGLACVASTHLAKVPLTARRQLGHLRRRVVGLARRAAGGADDALPAVLMGDLNLPPRAVDRGVTVLAEALTFPAWAPSRQIDHVLGVSGAVFAVGEAEARQLPVSDHRLLSVPVTFGG